MPKPREVFDNPQGHWNFITSGSDNEFEGQYFDRKEVGRTGESGVVNKNVLKKIRDQIVECISAFANTNTEGGLIVLGVASNGTVRGIKHLSENQVNSLTSFDQMLRNQAATVNEVDCVSYEGEPDKLLLVYVPYAEHGICETLESRPRAWVRNGKQNIPMSEQLREQIKRDKKIVEFEQAYCCEFHLDDVDRHVLHEFRKVFLNDAVGEYNDVELLYRAGAIYKDGDGYAFNNAGFLFFATNPQRILAWATIRLLRFEVSSEDVETRGLPTFDKTFDGPIPQQIRNMRTFFRESGFFKVYQRRI